MRGRELVQLRALPPAQSREQQRTKVECLHVLSSSQSDEMRQQPIVRGRAQRAVADIGPAADVTMQEREPRSHARRILAPVSDSPCSVVSADSSASATAIGSASRSGVSRSTMAPRRSRRSATIVRSVARHSTTSSCSTSSPSNASSSPLVSAAASWMRASGRWPPSSATARYATTRQRGAFRQQRAESVAKDVAFLRPADAAPPDRERERERATTFAVVDGRTR